MSATSAHRQGVVVEEYVWLHEICGMPEWQVARALGMQQNSMLEILREAKHARPAKTLQAIADFSAGRTMARAKVGRH